MEPMEEGSNTVQEIVRVCGPLTGRFAVFDFDNSCIVNDIQEATLAYLCKNSLLKNQRLAQAPFADKEAYNREVFLGYDKLLEEGQMKEAYIYAVRTMAGFSRSEIERLVSDVIRSEGEILGTQNLFGIDVAKGLSVRPEVKMLMESLLAAGCSVYVVTASSEEVVHFALKIWNFPEVVCIGVRNTESGGVFTDAIEEPTPIIERKVDCIKKFISADKKPVLAVGDSMNDLPMLEYAEVKVVVDRGNALAEKAKENGWYLI
jgi:HAD superfamily phosphoserine phosphatase-like hydrolase